MKYVPAIVMAKALEWCTSVLGPLKVVSDHSKEHGGHESALCRLQAAEGFYYLKVHQIREHWHREVYAYEQWADAFGDYAPKLVAAHDKEPLALLLNELRGQIAEQAQLPPSQERSIWQSAGTALIAFHDLGPGKGFGPCLRDGAFAETEKRSQSARDYVSGRFHGQMEQAIRAGYLTDDEVATLHAAYDLTAAFDGERPVPCHRDYCPANWLVGRDGSWAGVIDFEFAAWDVRVADFSRYPEWQWIDRPDLIEAFFEGYGRSLTSTEKQQLLVAHAEYALSAILWGHEYAFYGFEQEGRDALVHLASFLR